LPGKPDLYIGRLHLAVLIHGCFWHAHDCPRGRREPKSNAAYWSAKRARNAERDRATERALEHAGHRVAILWECQASGFPARCAGIAAEYHASRGISGGARRRRVEP
jgi:DNA mismatch endonuclease (patch repair protein)